MIKHKQLVPIIGARIQHIETGNIYDIKSLYAKRGKGIMRLDDGSEWLQSSWNQFIERIDLEDED